MTFESLYIKNFGKLSNQKFHFSDGVNIIEGANESGKSTICAFIRFIFYGLPSKSEEKIRYISWQSSTAGGSLVFIEDGRRYRIEREVICVTNSEGKNSFREKCAVYDAETNVVAIKTNAPGEHFFGVSASVFESTAYIRQMADSKVGGHALGEEAENILFSASENINTKKALAKLDSARVYLLHKNRHGGKIAELENESEVLGEKLEQAKKAGGDIIYLEGTHRQISEKMAESEKRLEGVRVELENYECYNLKKSYLKRRAEKARLAETDEKIAALKNPAEHGGAEVYTDEFIETLEKKQSDLEIMTARYGDAEENLAKANQKLSEMSDKLAIFERFGATGGKETLITRMRELHRTHTKRQRMMLLFFAMTAVFLGLTGATLVVPTLPALLKTILSIAAPVLAIASAVAGVFFLLKASTVGKDISTVCTKFDCKNYAEFEELVKAASEDELYMIAITDARDEATEMFHAASRRLEEISTDAIGILQDLGFVISDDTATSLAEAILHCREGKAELMKHEAVRAEQQARIDELDESLAAYPREYLRAACLADYDEAEMATFNLPVKKREYEFLTGAIKSQTEKLHQIEVELSALRAVNVKPTELAEEKASLDEEIERLSAKWSAYMLAIESLETAGGKLREGISPKIAKNAGRMMRAMTDGKYAEIGVDLDFGLSFSDGEAMHDAAYLSAGTGDLAYLCLRMALIELLYKKSVPPFIFDESFARMDDERLRRVLTLVSKYASRSYQSFLFTCHDREKNLMAEIGTYSLLSI